MKGVFLFHRDLRLEDNLALNLLCKACDQVVLLFVFEDDQIDPKRNKYFGHPAVQFMVESLRELDQAAKGRLLVMRGDTKAAIAKLHDAWAFDAMGFNEDYTPYARKRDRALSKWCESKGIAVHTAKDYQLLDFDAVRTQTGNVYSVFTPFYRATAKLPTLKPVRGDGIGRMSKPPFRSEIDLDKDELFERNEHLLVRGGRSEGLKRLAKAGRLSEAKYSKSRDMVSEETTLMGPYIKFGCVSVREARSAFEKNEPLLRQLYWHDFFAYVMYSTPELISKSCNFQSNVSIDWEDPKKNDAFERWCQGRTGVPMVDAAMRSMNKSGFMHNRSRMIVASFLTKNLLIDWRLGERYFATKLTDYDPSTNNGSWQWAASTGADAQPFFRTFSPYAQAKKHDSNAEYIKRWIPELADVDVKTILNWDDPKVRERAAVKYDEPIVDTKGARERFAKRYKRRRT